VLADRDLDPILRVPLTVRIARRLRDDGTIPAERPLPLTVSALRRQIDRSVADGSASDEPAVTRSPADDPATEDDGVQPGSDPISPQSGGEVPRIRLDDVTHVYDGGIPALENVSLEFAGECVMLMGANGAGKTTLVKHLNGLLAPTTGTVLVGESDTRTASVAALARRVGLVFQDPDTQLFRPTVEQAVRFGLENLGAPDVAARANRALERLSLADARTESTYELGRARRKRVAMASVLAMDTPVVVLDEPTGEQDARGVATIGSLVESLTAAGRTVICVTHDVEFARRHGDRVVVLADGQVIADGPPPTVLGDPEPLAQAGLEMPVPMRLGRALGLGPLPSVDRLLARLSTTSSRRST
jgi:energy-coupling factor transport system ATP-binding protein